MTLEAADTRIVAYLSQSSKACLSTVNSSCRLAGQPASSLFVAPPLTAPPRSWIRIGAYLNVIAHPDLAVARTLVRGGLSTFARFSVMHGEVARPASAEQRAVRDRVHERYDMTKHSRTDSDQASLLPAEFVDRFAVVGSPERCIERLRELVALGLDKVVVIGVTSGADPAEARRASELFVGEVLPAL